MTKIIEGKAKISGKKFGVVASRFNEFITKRLLDACLDELLKAGVRKNEITIVWVPGAFEIPLIAMRLARKKNIDCVICLGAVIRGETFHFEVVAKGAGDGISQVALTIGKPAILGILTTDTVEQAYKRSEPKEDNKGRDAARAAVEMVNVLAKM